MSGASLCRAPRRSSLSGSDAFAFAFVGAGVGVNCSVFQLGLDSVDALQLVVAIEKHFGLKVGDAEKAKEILQSVETIARAIEAEA